MMKKRNIAGSDLLLYCMVIMANTESVQERRLSPLAVAGIVTALGAAIVGGAAWASEGFRADIAETMADIAHGEPLIDLGPLADHDPIFDPYNER